MKHANLIAGLVVMIGAAGAPASALAQVDLSGVWAPIMHEDQVERAAGPRDRRLPRPADQRRRTAARGNLGRVAPDAAGAQCKPHPSTYGFRGVGNLRISSTSTTRRSGSSRSTRTSSGWSRGVRSGWTAGRIRRTLLRTPGRASRPAAGKGRCSSSDTTHLKAGWIRRNGVLLSDRATMNERFIRHGDLLTHVYIIEDPVYLTEPLIKTNGFRLPPNGACSRIRASRSSRCVRGGRGASSSARAEPVIGDFAGSTTCRRGVRGGAETALPEFARTGRRAGARRPPRSAVSRWRSRRGTGGAGRAARRTSPAQNRRCGRSTCRATSGCSMRRAVQRRGPDRRRRRAASSTR